MFEDLQRRGLVLAGLLHKSGWVGDGPFLIESLNSDYYKGASTNWGESIFGVSIFERSYSFGPIVFAADVEKVVIR